MCILSNGYYDFLEFCMLRVRTYGASSINVSVALDEYLTA